MCICTNKESKEKKGTCKHTGSGAASTCSCNCDDCLDCRGNSCKKNCKPAAGNLSICKASQGNTLTVGQRDQVSAHFNCGYAGNRRIGWRSSNPNVVKVDCYGNLTAVGEGYACIYAYVYGNSSVYDKITIHVTANGSSSSGSSGSSSGSSGENMTIDLLDNEFRPLAETLSDGPWVMNTGEKYQFNYSIRNMTGNPEVTWSSSNKSVVHVDGHGEVCAIGKGLSEVTVSIPGDSCTVLIEVSSSNVVPAPRYFCDLYRFSGETTGKEVRYILCHHSQVHVKRIDGSVQDSDNYGVNGTYFAAAHKLLGIAIDNGQIVETNGGKNRDPDETGEDAPLECGTLFAVNRENGDVLIGVDSIAAYEGHVFSFLEDNEESEITLEISNTMFAIGGTSLLLEDEDLTKKEYSQICSAEDGNDNPNAARTAIVYLGDKGTDYDMILLITGIGTIKEEDDGMSSSFSQNGMRYWDLRALINGMFSDFAASGEHIRGIALDGGGSTQIAYRDASGNRRTCYASSRHVYSMVSVDWEVC